MYDTFTSTCLINKLINLLNLITCLNYVIKIYNNVYVYIFTIP